MAYLSPSPISSSRPETYVREFEKLEILGVRKYSDSSHLAVRRVCLLLLEGAFGRQLLPPTGVSSL